ncbi:MAG: pentapeptide repeat-containing protein, partial [Bacillus sp. (in: firmicutes)]
MIGASLIGASFIGATFIGTSFTGFSLTNGCSASGFSFLTPKLIVVPGLVPIGASFFIVPPDVGTFIFIPGIIISGLLSCEFIFFSS